MQLPMTCRRRGKKNGSDIPDVSGAETSARVVSADVARWRKVVTEAGIKPNSSADMRFSSTARTFPGRVCFC